MIDAPLSLAFTAGMVATVNPCGFAMLPAYLSYFLGIGGDEDGDATAGVLRAVVVGLVVSAGFTLVFLAAGILLSATEFAVQRWTTRLTPVIGLLLVAGGIAFLAGWEPTLKLPHLRGRTGRRDRGLWSMFAFGASYAIASLACTIAPFTAAVAQTFTRSGSASGVTALLVYSLGMAVVLMALTVALATARQGLVHGLRRALPHVSRVAGGIMVLMGAYLTWYGIYEIRVTGGGSTKGAGPVDQVTDLSGRLSGWIHDTGALRLGLGLALVTVLAVLVALLRSPSPEE